MKIDAGELKVVCVPFRILSTIQELSTELSCCLRLKTYTHDSMFFRIAKKFVFSFLRYPLSRGRDFGTSF